MSHTLVDCDCTTKVHGDGSGVELYYCPLHAAAPDMKSLLQKVADHFAWTDAPLGEEARAMLREIEGKE